MRYSVKHATMLSNIPFANTSHTTRKPVYASFSLTSEMGSGDDNDIAGTFTEVSGSGDITTNTTGLFTVNTPGTYLVSFSTILFGETRDLTLRLKNGTTVVCTILFQDSHHGSGAGGGLDAVDGFTMQGSVMVPINAGDVLKLSYSSQNAVIPRHQTVSDGQRTWINFLKVS